MMNSQSNSSKQHNELGKLGSLVGIFKFVSDEMKKKALELPSLTIGVKSGAISENLLVQVDLELQRHGIYCIASKLFVKVLNSSAVTTNLLARLAKNAQAECNTSIAIDRWRLIADRYDVTPEHKLDFISSLISAKHTAEAQTLLLSDDFDEFFVRKTLMLSICYRNLGYLKDAIDLVEMTLQDHPGNVPLTVRKAQFLNQLGHFDLAETTIDALRHEHVGNMCIERYAGELALQARRFNKAKIVWRKVIETKPENSSTQFGFINALIEMGEIEEAQSLLDNTDEEHQSQLWWNCHLNILEKQGDEQVAVNYINKIIKATPLGTISPFIIERLYLRKISLLLRLCSFRSESDRFHEVHSTLKALLKFRPMNVAIRTHLIDLLIAEDRKKEAIVQIDLLPDDLMQPIVGFKMWKAHHSGDLNKAKQIWASHLSAAFIPQCIPTASRDLVRIDENRTSDVIDNVTLITVIKDEMARLPWFVDYYRKLGVKKFVIIDNGSRDQGPSYLLGQSDVYLYSTKLNYAESWDGVQWINQLATRHASRGWFLYVDVDEAMVFPGCEFSDLDHLTDYLARRGDEALSGVMVDMFAGANSFNESAESVSDYINAYPFFENNYNVLNVRNCPYKYNVGGFRNRLGGIENLTKTPLIRGGRDIILRYSSHVISPAAVSELTCALLHFKFTHTSQEEFSKVIKSGTRAGSCLVRHQRYLKNIRRLIGNTPVDHQNVQRYTGSSQLADLGLMYAPRDFHIGTARREQKT